MNNLLVIIELNQYDEIIYNFLNRVTPVLATETITFLHVAENLDIPKGILDKYPGLLPNIDESINSAIEEKIEEYEHISAHKKINVQTLSGTKLPAIAEFIRDNDIDLLILNRTDTNDEEVHFIQKMIRRSSCSVALIPPTIPENIQNVLVPMDFSKSSLMALGMAAQLSSQHKDMHVHGLHIYKLPHGYFKTGLSKNEFIEEMISNAKTEISKFVEQVDIDKSRFTMTYKMQNGNGIPYIINRFAFANRIDAIVLGSRGGSTISSFFLGRVTEALIDRDQYLPMIVVKNKGENLKLWEALSS
ncbi:MAG: universal stress protein [Balneolales bacterium]|nr:universal stress protein [Balneolales bacterium]